MWHELVMNGVGGCTIAEAKDRISYAEYLQWARYRNKRGSLHPGMRVEEGAALVASILANVNSKRGGFKITDFMAHAEEQPMTLDEAMDQWT